MKNKTVASCLIIVFSIIAFLQPAVLGQDVGQPRFGTWEAVKAVPSGDKLQLKLKSGRDVKGEITSVFDSGITLGRGSNAVTIGRDDIQRVFRVNKKSSGKPALVGALIGAGIGAGGIAVAVAANDGGGGEKGELAVITTIVALAGAGVGALVGSIFRTKKQRTLIYESR